MRASSLVLLIALVAVSHAATFYISPFGSSRGAGTSQSPWGSLKYAISQMNNNDVCVLQQGLYSGSDNIGATIATSLKNITLRGESGSEQTILWCEGTSATALTVNGDGATISGIQFSDCATGVYVYTPNVNITNSKFSQCGSGLKSPTNYNFENILISNANFEGNTIAVNFDRTAGTTRGNFTIENSIIHGFYSQRTRGLLVRRFESSNFVRCVFKDLVDTNAYGAAIYVYYGESFVSFCNFTNNAGSSGGALYAISSESIIDNSSFLRNYASGSGGAIYQGTEKMMISNSEFRLNHAKDNGGAVNSNGVINIQNTQIVHNLASYGGGSFFNTNSAANCRNAVFTNNNGTEAGGAFVCKGAAVNLFDSVVSDNISDERSTSAWSCESKCKVFKSNTKITNNTADC